MPQGFGYDPEGIRAFLASLTRGGFRGSPADRGLRAVHREVLDPARRSLQRAVRGDALAGDIGLSDLGTTRPARFLRRAGEFGADAFRSAERFATREEPRLRAFLGGLLR